MMFVVLAATYKVYGGDYTYRIMGKKLSWTEVKTLMLFIAKVLIYSYLNLCLGYEIIH